MKIATHSGVFHADEVMAIAILLGIWPEAKVTRTRDAKVLAEMDVIVDVGGVYDPDRGRFDHHQRQRAGIRPNGILYSAAGLVWKHYGKMWLAHNLEVVVEGAIDYLHKVIDARIIQPIDAVDNGIKTHAAKPEYGDVSSLSFSSVISNMNPSWNDGPSVLPHPGFSRALIFAMNILSDFSRRAYGELLAEDFVAKAIEKSASNGVLVLEQSVPWNKMVIEHASDAVFVVFPNTEEGTWMCQGIPKELGSFECRRRLPSEWGGLSDAELAQVTGVADAVFCHRAGFICGARSREGALALAQKALG